MAYLYSPPTWRNVFSLSGALIAGIKTSTCVYRQGGVWANTLTAGPDVVPDTEFGVELFFTRPTEVPDALHDELAANAITPADSSWSPGTLTLI